MQDLFDSWPGHRGRPLADFTHRLEHGCLPADTARVQATGEPLECEVRDTEGRRYLVRMPSHRMPEGAGATGVVITLVRLAGLDAS